MRPFFIKEGGGLEVVNHHPEQHQRPHIVVVEKRLETGLTLPLPDQSLLVDEQRRRPQQSQ